MERSEASIRRCTIYTRKSSEEGLEQDFNSLQAQRQACRVVTLSVRWAGDRGSEPPPERTTGALGVYDRARVFRRYNRGPPARRPFFSPACADRFCLEASVVSH